MAGNVDQRIIQMQFDNREFEKNIAKSTRSIEELKEAMDFEETSRGLEKFADSTKVLGFDSLANNVEKLMNKFTGLGTVSEYVLSRIRSMAEGAAQSVERFIKSISIDQIATGQSKYDQLNKAVMTIVSGGIASETEAYNVMERVAAYTDQTSHSFETMVSKISDLTSRGMGLDEAERLIEAMGNAATYAGQGATEAAMSMNVLSKAMAGQFLGYEQYLQLANTSKVITAKWKEQAIQAGLAVGTLVEKQGKYYTQVQGQKAVEVSVQNLENTLRSRWLTSDALKKLYANYMFGDTVEDLAHPEEAIVKAIDGTKEEIGKKMQEMFPDSNVDLLKRKVVKMGDDIATVLTETFTASKDGREGLKWNQDLVMNITPITEDGKVLDGKEVEQYVEDLLRKSTNVKELLKNDKKANGGKGLVISADVDFKSFDEGIKNAENLAEELHNLQAEYYKDGKSMNSINTEFGRTAYLTGQRALTLADAINAIKESVSSGWMESFRHIFGDVTEAAEHFTNICNRVIESLEKIKEFRNGILESWAVVGGRTSLFRLLLGDYEEDVQSGAVGLLDLLDGVGKMVYNGFVDFIGLFAGPASKELMKEDPQYFNSYLGAMLKGITDKVQQFFQRIHDFFNGTIEVDGQVRTRLDVIQDIVKGVVGALKLGLDLLDGVRSFILEIGAQLTPSFDAIITFLAKLGEEIFLTAQETGDAGTIKTFFHDLAETLKPITDGINSVVEAFTHFLTVLLGLDEEGKDRTETFRKIGDILLSVGDIIAKIAGPILDFVASVINAFTALFDGGVTPEKFEAFGKSLSDGFSIMMKTFADSLPDSFGFLGDWIRDLFGLWEDEAGKERKTFFSFLHKLFTGEFGGLGELIHSLFNGFSLKDALESGFGFLSAFNFLQQVVGFFKGTNLYGVIMAFLGVATLASLISLIRKAKKGVSEFTAFFADVGGNLKQGFLGDYEWTGEKIKNIAVAIGILVGSVAILGSLKPEAMIQGLIGVGLIIGAVIVLFEYFKRNKSTFAERMTIIGILATITAVILAITIGLSILLLAILPLASDPGKMIAAVLGIAGMLTAIGFFLVLVVGALQKFTGNSWDSSAKRWNKIGQLAAIILIISVAMIAISAAIGSLAIALTPLALTGWDGMLRAIIAFAAFLAIFGGFMVIMINTLDSLAFKIGGGKGWAGYGKMALSMITLAASISLMAVGIGALVLAITPLAMMSWGGFVRAMAGLGIVLLELGAMVTYITHLTTADKTATLKIAGFAAFAFSLGILILALTPLALMTWNAWGRAMLGLTIVLAELAVMMGIVKHFNLGTGPLLGFAGFAASIGILIFSLSPLAAMDWGGWGRAMIGLTIVLTEIVAVAAIIKHFKIDTGSLVGFIGFAVSIGILLFALKPLSEMSPQGYMQALIGLGAVMLEVIVLMHIMNEIKPDLKSSIATLLMMVGLGAAMILFSIAFNEVKDVPWPVIAAFAAGMALIIGAIGVAAKAGNGLSIKGILMISIAIAAVLGVFTVMIPLLMGAVGSSLSGFAARLAMFAELMSTFSSKMGGVDEGSIEKFESILGTLKDAIAIMVSLMINDGAIKSYLNAIASMTLISDQLVILQDRVSKVKMTTIGNLSAILTQIGYIFDNQVSQISKFTGVASLFSDAMYNLGTGIEIFNNHTGNVGNVEENSALQLIQALAGCADDMKTIYDMKLDRITSQMSGLGGALMLYAEGAKEASDITGFDPSDEKSVSAIAAAVKIMQAITTAFAAEGGAVLPENMPSEEDFGTFGAQLAALAGALMKFEQAGTGLGTGTDKALEILDFFQKLKDKLIKSGFKENLQESMNAFKDANGNVIAQKNELETFGKNIEQLGLSLGQFAQSTQQQDAVTKEMKPIDYTMATTALDSIVKLGEKLPSVGGVIQKFTGTRQDIGDLAVQVESLGSAMGLLYERTSTFNEKTGTYTPYDFSNQIAFLNCIGTLQSNLPYIGGINLRRAIVGDQMTFDELGQNLEELGAGLNVMSSSITGKDENGNEKFDAAKATEAANVLKDHMIPLMTTLGKELPKVGGLGQIWETITSGREANMEDVANAMGQLGTGLGALGKGITEGGFESSDAVKNAFSALESVFGAMVRIQQLLVENNGLFENEGIGIASFRIFEALSDFLQDMTEGGEDFATGEQFDPIFDKIKAFVSGISEAFGELEQAAGGMENLQGRVNIFKIFGEGLNALTNTDFTGDWGKIGTKLTEQVATAITEGAASVNTAAKNLFLNAYTEAGTVEGVDWPGLGTNIATGVASGVQTAGSEHVTPAVRAMMIEAYNAGKEAIKSNSPSKLFMQLGAFAGEGMAIGIDKESNEVGKSAGALGNVALDKAQTMIALISSIMAEDVNAQPTITPVLDMSEVEAGLNSYFGSGSENRYTIGLDTSLGAAIASALAANEREPYDFNQLKPDYTGIYTKLDGLGQQVNSLGKAISNIKIILNTGVVAGGVTNDVDRNIGRKTFYAGRNNG